jgi:hypothetical protein
LPCRYQNNIQPNVTIDAEDTSVEEGDSTRITWNSNNADYCYGSGGSNNWSGNKNTSGSFNTGSLSSTKIFRITCTNDDNGASDTDSVTINVDEDNNNNNNNDEPDVETERATNIEERSARLNGNVDGNGLSTRTWFEYGTSRSMNEETNERSSGSGSRDFDERITGLRENTTYYFRAVARNSEGTVYGDIESFRTNDGDDEIGNVSTPLTAVTTPATQITSNSATLNGLVLTGNNNSNSNAWFEWGTSLNLGNRTNNTSLGNGSSVRHAGSISGLAPGTTYYFRIVAENSSNRNVGSILTFETPRNTLTLPFTPVAPTVVRNITNIVNTGGSGGNSLVMLTIDGGSEFITENERREYTVTWKNISNQTLRDVVLRVVLPGVMDFGAADKGMFSNVDNTLTYNIGTLRPDETDTLILLAKTDDNLKQGELVIVVANLVYTDRSDVQGDALAYATHKAYIDDGSVLGANVFGAGFESWGLFGWLLLIILILILILVAKSAFSQRPRPPHGTTGGDVGHH